MTTIVTILTEGYADWETALLNAAARQYYGTTTLFASPEGKPVRSAGGLLVTPDFPVEAIEPKEIDALILNGGTIWASPEAPDLTTLLHAAGSAGVRIAAICDATLALAKAGLLDAIPHTSNGPDTLKPTGYFGAAHYQDQPLAVASGKIITAPGTAPVSFMSTVMESLGLRNDELDFYLGFHAAEHQARSPA